MALNGFTTRVSQPTINIGQRPKLDQDLEFVIEWNKNFNLEGAQTENFLQIFSLSECAWTM